MLLLNVLATVFVCSTGTCVDRTDQWKIGKHTKYWCSWAGQKQTASRCERKSLLDDCPVTCDNCPSVTPAPVASTPTPTPPSNLDPHGVTMIYASKDYENNPQSSSTPDDWVSQWETYTEDVSLTSAF